MSENGCNPFIVRPDNSLFGLKISVSGNKDIFL